MLACQHYLEIMECKVQVDSAIRQYMITWEYAPHSRLISIAVDPNGLKELSGALERILLMKKSPKNLQNYAQNILTFLLNGRKLMREIETEYSQNSCYLTPDNFPQISKGIQIFTKSHVIEFKTLDNIQKKILDYEFLLTSHEKSEFKQSSHSNNGERKDENFLFSENLSEIFIIICELKKRKIVQSYCEIISSQCISGHTGNIVCSQVDIEYSHQLFLTTQHELSSFQQYLDHQATSYGLVTIPHSFSSALTSQNKTQQFFQHYLQTLLDFNEIASILLQIRLNFLANNWDELEKIFMISSEGTSASDVTASSFKHYLEIYEELQLIESEINHRNLIKEMKITIENLQITLIPNTQNLNPTPSLIIYDRLERVLAWAQTIGCHSQQSVELKSLCEIILRWLQFIKTNETHQISLLSMLEVQQRVEVLSLSCQQLNIVFGYIRSYQIIHTIYMTTRSTTLTHDSKALYVVISKAEEACGGMIELTLQPWIDLTNDLRYLRVLLLNKDWLTILEHSQEMNQSLISLSSFCYSDEQKKLHDLIQRERVTIHLKALNEHTNIQLHVMSTVGGIGARGSTSYCTPEMGIKILKDVIGKIDSLLLETSEEGNQEILTEILTNKKKLIALLNLRESVYDEVSVIGVPARSRVSSRKIDHTEDTTPNILDHLPNTSMVTPLIEMSSTAKMIHAARKRTFNTLEETEKKLIQSSHLIEKEYEFTSNISKLTTLVEALEATVLLPVVGWKSDVNQVQFFSQNSLKQKEALENLVQTFPQRIKDIPLVMVTTDLNELLLIAQTNGDYAILDNLLNTFSLKIQVAGISPRVLLSLKDQVAVFQRGHLLDQLTSLAEEGCRLLEMLCFKRDILDEYLTKFTYLANSAGEQSVPQETMSCIRCIQCCRDLCWASELQMGIEFQRFKKQLDKEAEDVPSWFHDKLIRWVRTLPPPLYMPAVRGSISQVGKRPLLRNSLQQHISTIGTLPNRPSRHLSSLDENGSQTASIEIHFSLKNLSQSLSLMVTKKHTPEFILYQKPFLDWSNRVLLLNTLWRGLFCMTEDWVTPVIDLTEEKQSSVASSTLPSASPMFHTDIHALSILCQLLNETILKEENFYLQQIVREIVQSFEKVLETLHPKTHKSLKSSLNFPKLKEYEDTRRLMNLSPRDEKHRLHIETILNCVKFTQRCIDVLQAIAHRIQRFYLSTISYRTVFQIKYQPEVYSSCYLRASVISTNRVCFTILDPITDWYAKVTGHVVMIKALCCQWSDSQKNGLSELIHAFQQAKNSLSKFVYRLKGNEESQSGISGRLYCLSIRVLPNQKTLLTIYDPILNDHLTLESSTEFHYIFRSNTRAMKMVCVGADAVQQYWETHFDPSLISSIKEILGPQNTGNANTDLSTVLRSARDNIRDSLRVLEQKCSLLLLTQIGFCFMNYSPWDLHWIDKSTIKDGVKVCFL
jgi:hypothetical protein